MLKHSQSLKLPSTNYIQIHIRAYIHSHSKKYTYNIFIPQFFFPTSCLYSLLFLISIVLTWIYFTTRKIYLLSKCCRELVFYAVLVYMCVYVFVTLHSIFLFLLYIKKIFREFSHFWGVMCLRKKQNLLACIRFMHS